MTKSYVTKYLRTHFYTLGFLSLLSLVLFLFPQNVYSLDVTFAWDPNSEENLAGYRVFYHEDGQSYDYKEPAWEGSETKCTIYNLDDNTGYYFVARAFDTEGLESGNSTELSYQPTGNDAPEPTGNDAPVADAGPDQTVNEGDTVTLDGSNSSDPDGAIASYSWIQTAGTSVALSDATAAQPTFTAPYVGQYGESLTFQLTVTDDYLKSTDTCMVNITWVNEPPPDAPGAVENEPPPDTPGAVEIGEVSVDHNWKRVEFNNTFIDPVVVAKPLSYHGEDPAVLRIRNVDSKGFDIRVQEWDYLDGAHTTENVSYLVMEQGGYSLEDGTKVEAGTFDTDATGSFGRVDFSQTFNQVPVVTSTVSSFNEKDAVCSRLKNIDTTGFDFRMQEQELNSQIHTTETISYIAWEPSSGTVGNLTFEVDKTDDVITHNLQTIVYHETFMAAPVFLADMQTTNNGDTANLRWQNKDLYGIDIKISEEKSREREINHNRHEVVGYMVFAFIE